MPVSLQPILTKPTLLASAVVLPLSNYGGTLPFAATPVALNSSQAGFEVDISNIGEGQVLTLSLDESLDGGKTWHLFGSVTIDSTCDPTKPAGMSALFDQGGNQNEDYQLRGTLTISQGTIATTLTSKIYG